MKRRSKILIGMVLALGAAWVLSMLVSHKNARDKVAAYKQELRAKGEKLTFAELAPPPSTKRPNGATALTNAFSYSSSMNYPLSMVMIAPGVARIEHTNLGAELTFNYASNVKKAAELRAILTNAAVLDFNLNYAEGANLQLTHLSKLKAAEIVLSTTAMQALYKKDYSEARLDLCAAVDLVRLFDNEPIMISTLVRIAMMRIAVPVTWEALCEEHWTDAELAELQAKWEDVELFKMAELIFAMERADGINSLLEARKSPDFYVQWQTYYSGGSPGPSPSAISHGWADNLQKKLNELYIRYPRYWIWKSSWSYEEELCYLQIITADVEAARNLKATGAFVPVLNELRRQTAIINGLYPDGTNHFMLLGGYNGFSERFFTKLAATETARRLLVTAIALERYHFQHGTYPAGLNELVPNYVRQVPLDFMDGKPLRYRLLPDGDFLLYSVGEDGEDNGGDPLPVDNRTIRDWLAARDAVWPRAATAAEVEKYESHSDSETNVPSK